MDIATKLNVSSNVVAASDIVARFALEYLSVDQVAVAILDLDDPSLLEIVAAAGEGTVFPIGRKVPVTGTISGRALLRGERSVFNPIEHIGKMAQSLSAVGFRIGIEIPLMSGAYCFGALHLGSRSEEVDVDTAAQIGRLLGSQIDRITTHERLQHQLGVKKADTRRWELLRNLEERAGTTSSIDEMMTEVAAIFTEISPGSQLTFLDHSGHCLIRRETGDQSSSQLRFGDSQPADFLTQLSSPADPYASDLDLSIVNDTAPEIVTAGASSLIGAPVNGRSGALGLVLVSSAIAGFGAGERDMLKAIAAMVGATIERIEVDDRLTRAATHDQLTGLIQRPVFEKVLGDEIAAVHSRGRVSAMATFDVDRFKVINDTEGHLNGDDFLVQLSRRLGRRLGRYDVGTRVGGDEFAVLLRGLDAGEYELEFEELVRMVSADPFTVGSRTLQATISLGWVLLDGSVESASEAISMADAACYTAKMVGGNQARRACPDDDNQWSRRTASESLLQLRRTIENDDLVLYGQPIINLATNTRHAVEVLVRMQDPEGGLIMPDLFLPIAERFHATEPLDEWVVKHALAALARCDLSEPITPQLFINLSPSSVTSVGFADRIERLVLDSGVPPRLLCFEITENGTMKSFDEALRFVDKIRSIGAMVALDDFGVGLSSLGHLYRLPVEVLKIDGSLVKGIEASSVNSTMVSTVQALADSLGKATVAEFIENSDAVDALRKIGIDCGQGFYLGRPSPLHEQLGVGVESPHYPNGSRP